jgi:hypothetical protein
VERLDLDKAFAPLEPIGWPGGGEQAVKRLTWRQEQWVTDLATADETTAREIVPKIMAAILPGRSWDEIQDALDMQTMRDVIVYASREYQAAMHRLEATAGNGVAGAAPASPPPTPESPSLPASPAPTAVPCGAS